LVEIGLRCVLCPFSPLPSIHLHLSTRPLPVLLTRPQQDSLWAAVFATCTITLTIGSSSKTLDNIAAGVTKLKIPLATGQITVKTERGGQTD
jgi:hypothetical protein